MSGAYTEDQWRRIEQFLYLEARLADESRYAEWEDLWADDGVYWMPTAPDADPTTTMSLIFDNRRRISTRIRQLSEGRRPTQTPASIIRRVVSNIESLPSDTQLPPIFDRSSWDAAVSANFVALEVHGDVRTFFVGRTVYGLRSSGDTFKLTLKKVELPDAALPLPTISFLI